MLNNTLVLVVDDDLSVRRALDRLLSSVGFAVGVFASGSELLASPASRAADCIVLDVHLGGPDGFEVCLDLRAAGVATPVIFITAHDSATTRTRAATFSRSAFLPKPFDATVLIDLIRAMGVAAGPTAGAEGGVSVLPA
jgi:FixJ family two-component response regulator